MIEGSMMHTITTDAVSEAVAALVAAGVMLTAGVAALAWGLVLAGRELVWWWRLRRGWAECLGCGAWCRPGTGEVCQRCAAWAQWAIRLERSLRDHDQGEVTAGA